MTLSGSDIKPMKNQIRLAAIAKRKSLTQSEVDSLSAIIQKSLMDTDDYKEARTIMLYKGAHNEVSTDFLIDDAVRSKIVLLPSIFGDSIIPTRYEGVLKEGTFGIYEPEGPAFAGEIDLIIVPVVAFDSNLGRIGRGLGYYDRFLKKYNSIKIGLAFEVQKVMNVPVEPHDEKLHRVITEGAIYK